MRYLTVLLKFKPLRKLGITTVPSLKVFLRQFVSFALVGLTSTLLFFGVYSLCLWAGLHYVPANILGFCVSILNTFFLNSRFVFKNRRESNNRSFFKLICVYGTVLIINNFLLYAFVELAGIPLLIAPLLCLVLTIPLNFILSRFWVFKESRVKEPSSPESANLAWHIRRHALEMANRSGGSHIASALSVSDIVAVLYASVMNIFPSDPKHPGRDRFILSKGHAGSAVYAALAESGFFPVEELGTYYADGSRLSGHVSHKDLPGVELSTGSLGHGLGVGAGMAHAAKMDSAAYRVFVILGDGECDEGSVWEAALYANHYRLNNLCAIVDHNKLQSLDLCENTIELIDLSAKFSAFGWEVRDVDGHDHDALKAGLTAASGEKPVCVIAHTVKGKGVSFMEGEVLWHYRDPQGECYEKAKAELEAQKP